MYKKISLFLSVVSAITLTACASNTAQQHYLLGQQYYHAQNYGDAFKEISKAAKGGNADAQYALGYMYYNGIGTALDNQTGLFWIKQAANQSQPQAMKAVNLLNNKPLSPLPIN